MIFVELPGAGLSTNIVETTSGSLVEFHWVVRSIGLRVGYPAFLITNPIDLLNI